MTCEKLELGVEPAVELEIEFVEDEWVMHSSIVATEDIEEEIGRGLDFLDQGDYVVLVVSLGEYHAMIAAGVFDNDTGEDE